MEPTWRRGSMNTFDVVDDMSDIEGDSLVVDDEYESSDSDSSELSISSTELSEVYSSEEEKEYTTMSRFRRRRGGSNIVSTTGVDTSHKYATREDKLRAKRSAADGPDFASIVLYLVVWSMIMVTIIKFSGMSHVVKEILRPLLVIVAIPTGLLFILIIYDFRQQDKPHLPARRVHQVVDKTHLKKSIITDVERESMTMHRGNAVTPQTAVA